MKATIQRYLDRAGPSALASVGGYQTRASARICSKRIRGDHFTILGLPLLKLLAWMRAERLLNCDPSTGRLRAGVAGWPVKHSRSPLIHNYWLERSGSRVSMICFQFRLELLRASRLRSAGTGSSGRISPFRTKRRPSGLAIEGRRWAEALGAVNVLWRENGLLCGDNTDVFGFLANLDECAPGWAERDERRLFWEPEAARAQSLFGLIGRGFERICVVNRT